MNIKNNCVVSFTYTISKESGEVLDSTNDKEAISYIHGVGAMLPGIEKIVDGKEVGFTYSGVIESKDAYGEYLKENVMPVPKAHFEHLTDQMEEGKLYKFDTGGGHTKLMRVVSIDDQFITMDANHPLAGENINIECKVLEVREATEDELNSLNKGCGCGSHGSSGKSGGCCSDDSSSQSGGCCKEDKKSSGCGCKH